MLRLPGGLIAINERTGDAPRRVPRAAHASDRIGRRALAFALAFARAVAVASWSTLAFAAPPGATDAQDSPEAATRAARTPTMREVEGRVVRVLDGDSLLVRLADGQVRGVRIAGIDAPEKGQPHADVSRRALLAQLHERDIRVEAVKTDRFDRLVGRVFVENRDAGLAQLRAGLAWHFTRYDADLAPAVRRRYAQAERRARLQGIGLWREAAPLPPWEHRARARATAGSSVAR